ncbi:hypothetical protein TNCV_4653161 [Trichonephila clavipes]|nr:hypothetical protein TNCV_4653161 [Trichonephila clavipes]
MLLRSITLINNEPIFNTKQSGTTKGMADWAHFLPVRCLWVNWVNSSQDHDTDNFMGGMLFLDIFFEELGISNFMPTGNDDKITLLYNNHRPHTCLGLGLPP